MLMGCMVSMLSGCASITSGSVQFVRVDALNEDGEVVQEATCEMKNKRGVFKTTSGEYTSVHKSNDNLNIVCASTEFDDKASGLAISRAGAGMFGNIIFGGGIGAIIDHSSGTAYNYPEWMQVEFGKTLVFDRFDHEDGVALRGKVPEDGEIVVEISESQQIDAD